MQINSKIVTLQNFKHFKNVISMTGPELVFVAYPKALTKLPLRPPVGSAVFLDVNNGWCGQSGTVNYSVIAFRFELGT